LSRHALWPSAQAIQLLPAPVDDFSTDLIAIDEHISFARRQDIVNLHDRGRQSIVAQSASVLTFGTVDIPRLSIVRLEAVTVSEAQRDPITEGVQKIIFSLIILVAHSEIFNLIDEMVPRPALICGDLVEGLVGVLDLSLMDVAGYGKRPFVLAHCGQLRLWRGLANHAEQPAAAGRCRNSYPR
jgi:hypothetical protein